jgi:uncharacterized membrane protein
MKVVSYVYNALSKLARRIKMKTLSICCGVVSAILLSVGAGSQNTWCSSTGGVLLVLTVVFWFLGSKDNK